MVAPSGEGAVRCMKMSMQNLRHSKIDYVNIILWANIGVQEELC
jgi:hypothetical protein